MMKRLLAFTLALSIGAAVSAGPVDINSATQAELETVQGIGTSLSTRIVDERSKGPFKDWNDLRVRVKGMGVANAAKLSAAGLTVNGASFEGRAAK